LWPTNRERPTTVFVIPAIETDWRYTRTIVDLSYIVARRSSKYTVQKYSRNGFGWMYNKKGITRGKGNLEKQNNRKYHKKQAELYSVLERGSG